MICTTLPRNKRVLVRVDLNVPVHDDRVMDDTRMRLIVPTIKALRQAKNQCFLIAHLGRPKGWDPHLSLRLLVPILEHLLEESVTFAPDIKNIPDTALLKGCVLLENVRFYPEEEANEVSFSQHLARLGDFYVNDAFSASHRAHASIVGVPAYLPHAAGPLFQQELKALQRIVECPIPPVIAIVGGGKISTKFGLLHNLLKKTSVLAVGGGLAHTLLAAQDYIIGQSLCEMSMLDQARTFLKQVQHHSCTLLLPIDVVVRTKDGTERVCEVKEIPSDAVCLDVGPATCQYISEAITQANTVLWNGPLGRFEEPPFHKATEKIMHTIAEETQRRGMVSVIGGGDSVAALNAAKMDFAQFSYVSTSGGAFLEFLEGKELPGIQALR
ncbi:MAG: phosphoglycerate kinase [Holosporales bacterium]|jgi:phosphoglycerate kinase|nr:phosphoglycerate kinase [Holosporales bacterium]